MASFRNAIKDNTKKRKGTSFRSSHFNEPLSRNAAGETTEEAFRGQFERGFDIGATNLREGAFNAVRAVGDKTGIEGVRRFGEEGAAQAEEEMAGLPKLAEPKIQDTENVGEVLDWAAGGLGQLGPSLLGMAGGAAAGAAAAPVLGAGALAGAGAGAFLSSAVPETGHAYEDIEEATGEKAFWTSVATGGAIGALDRVSAGKLVRAGLPNRILQRLTRGEALDEAEKRGVRAAAANIAKATATEGATEGAQGFVGNVGRATHIEDLDPLSEEAISNYINEAAIGALGGGTIGTIGSVAKNAGGRTKDAIEGRLEQRDARRAAEEAAPGLRSSAALDRLRGLVGLRSRGGNQIAQRQGETFDPELPAQDNQTAQRQGETFDPELPAQDNQIAQRQGETFDPELPAVDQDGNPVYEQLDGPAPAGPEARESRGTIALRGAIDDGSLQERFEAQGLSREDAALKADTVRIALDSADYFIRNPDQPVPQEFMDNIERVLSDPTTRQFYDEGSAFDQEAADAGLDEVVGTPNDQGQINAERQAAVDEGAALAGEESYNLNLPPDNAVEYAPTNVGEPLQTTEASNKLRSLEGDDRKFESGAAEKAAERFNRRNRSEGKTAKVVSYTEYMKDALTAKARKKGLQGPEVDAFVQKGLEEEAQSRLEAAQETNKKVARLFDENDPASFLDNFAALEIHNEVQQAKGSVDSANLMPEDLAVTNVPSKKQLQRGEGTSTMGAGLLHGMNKGGANPNAGFTTVTVEGRKNPVRLDAHRLTSMFRNKARSPQRASNKDLTSSEQIADAFYRGIAQLLSVDGKSVQLGTPEHHQRIEVLKQKREAATTRKQRRALDAQLKKEREGLIPDSLVVFHGKDGTKTTYGEIKSANAPGKKAESLERRLAALFDEMDAKITESQNLEEGSTEQRRIEDRLGKIGPQIEQTEKRLRSARKEAAAQRTTSPEERAQETFEQRRREDNMDPERRDVKGVPEPEPRLAEPTKTIDEGFNFRHEDVRDVLHRGRGDPSYEAAYTAEILHRYLEWDSLKVIPSRLINHGRSLLPDSHPAKYSDSAVVLKNALDRYSNLPSASKASIKAIKNKRRLFRAAGFSPNIHNKKASEQIAELNAFMKKHEERIKAFERAKEKGQKEHNSVLGAFEEALNDPATTQILEDIVEQGNAWAKELGLSDVHVLGRDEMLHWLKNDVDGESFVSRMADGELFGVHMEVDGRHVIAINPFADQLTAVEQLAHEIGHVVKIEAGHRLTNFQATALMKEFHKWRRQVDSSSKSVYEVLGSKKTPRAKLVAMLQHTSQIRMGDLSSDQQAYLLDFDEWFADRVAAGLLKTSKKKTMVDKILDTITGSHAQALRKMFGDNKATDADLAFAMIRDGGMQEVMRRTPSQNSVWAAMDAATTNMNESKSFVGPRQMLDLMEDIVQERLDMSLKELSVTQRTLTRNEWNRRIILTAASNKADAMSELNRVMMEWAFDNMLEGNELAALGRLANSPRMRNKLLARLDGDQKAIDAINDPRTGNKAAVGYMYQMHMLDPQGFPLNPKARGIIDKIRSMFLDLIGVIEDSTHGQDIMNAFEHGKTLIGNRAFTMRPNLRDNVFQAGAQDAIEGMRKIGKRVNIIAGANQVLVNTEIPALQSLTELFDVNAGSVGRAKTFTEERTVVVTRYANRVFRILKPLNKTEQAEVKALLHNYVDGKDSASPKVKRAADDVLLLLDDMFGLFTEAGMEGTGHKTRHGKYQGLGKRGAEVQVTDRDGNTKTVRAYFPWVLDIDKLTGGGAQKLHNMLMRPEYKKKIEEMMGAENRKRTNLGLQLLNKEDFVSMMISHLMNENGNTDSEINPDYVGFTPRMSAFNPREWAWVTETYDPKNPVSKESIADWTELQDDSVHGVLNSYVEQGVKRAIYTRRFGASGYVLTEILEQAKKEGATDKDLGDASKYIDAMLGTHGARNHERLINAANWVRNKLGMKSLEIPPPGQPINPKLQKATQWMMVYQNFRILDYAVITSLVDPVGIFARTGDVRMAWNAFKIGMKDAYDRNIKGEEGMQRSITEQLGIVENHMLSEAIQWNSGNFMSGRARWMNDQFFKWNGLQGWTRITRVMATSAAQQFLRFHAGRLDNETSTRYLQELGLSKEDTKAMSFDSAGNIQLMPETEYNDLVSKAGRDEDARQKLAQEDRIRYAIVRFTNEAVLRPNAAHRPIWASDPHFAVFFHLKQFMWTFHTRILKRMGSELANGQISPVVSSALMYVSVMAAVDQAREYLKHGSGGSEHKASWGITDHVWNAIQRSGLTGTYQAMIDAREDTYYGGYGFESFMGPTANQAWSFIKSPWKDQEYMTRQLNRAIPFTNTRESLDLNYE